MKNISYLSLGTNLGNKAINIKVAIEKLNRDVNIAVLCESSIYETSPLYNLKQNNFYNNVVKIKTSLTPMFLLYKCKEIEGEMGRENNSKRNMPRIIDIDILVYDDIVLRSDELILPHPRLYERKFVLIPMRDIQPQFIFPNNKSINETLNIIEDSSKIIKLDKFIS